jgi:serine/threonine protein kinase
VAPSERSSNPNAEEQSFEEEAPTRDEEAAEQPKKMGTDDGRQSDNQEKLNGKTGSIKFAMKLKPQAQSPVVKRPNPIISLTNPPARTNPANTPNPPNPPNPPREPRNFADEEAARYGSVHSRPPPPNRFGGPRQDDWGRPGQPSRERDYAFQPPISPARERKPPDYRGRPPPPGPRQPPKPARPRRKKIIKVTKTHRRVVLPPKKLPEDWAKSKFMYYPKPDGQSVVGAGTYGKVFKASNIYRNKLVALKTLPLFKHKRKPGTREYQSRDKKKKRQDRWVKEGLHLTSLREIKLLKSISHQHENVVGIQEIFLESQCCNLVFNYFEFDMHGIIYSANVDLSEGMMKDLVRQVFNGLDFLHTKASILHRDIKAANILVGTNGQVKITDFGLAKHVKNPVELEAERWHCKRFEHSNRVITTPYRPPELLLGAALYGGEVDVWSAGCVLFEAFLKRLPFQGTGEDVDHLLTIWKILGEPNAKLYPEVVDLEWYWLFASRVRPKKSIFAKLYQDKVSPQLYHLLRCIFQHDPKKRPTAAQVLTHPFFTLEQPLPISAAPVLENVEGEWHELEYKMIRDKEKAQARRKHEDNVILGYLEHKQQGHDSQTQNETSEENVNTQKERADYYKSEREQYHLRMQARTLDNEEDIDHAAQVAEMKKTHGEMYMDVSRRGRYRGPAREKIDEKLLEEAWKWYEEERKKGNNPVPSVPPASKGRKNKTTAKASQTDVLDDTHVSGYHGKLKVYENALITHKAKLERYLAQQGLSLEDEKVQGYDKKLLEVRRVLETRETNELSGTGDISTNVVDKRVASSPLADDRDMKKLKEDYVPK